MKKLTVTAAAAALLLPAAAMAAHIPTGAGPGGTVNTENPDGFKNKGQCQAALSREINRQRQNPDERAGQTNKDRSTSEFQLFMLDRFECALDDDDRWKVFLSADLG